MFARDEQHYWAALGLIFAGIGAAEGLLRGDGMFRGAIAGVAVLGLVLGVGWIVTRGPRF